MYFGIVLINIIVSPKIAIVDDEDNKLAFAIYKAKKLI